MQVSSEAIERAQEANEELPALQACGSELLADIHQLIESYPQKSLLKFALAFLHSEEGCNLDEPHFLKIALLAIKTVIDCLDH